MQKHGYAAAYQTDAVVTAGPAQLVLMLYQGAIDAISRARAAEEARLPGRIEIVNRELVRAQDIVTELQVALDHEQGGQVAGNLEALYRFCVELLVEANVSKDLHGLDPVINVLSTLRDAWEESCCVAPVA